MRASGILMPISSLPSPYGIGTMGAAARSFVDFLVKSGQAYWQILPVCPTSYGDSPYQSFSTFAGNPYFIDLDDLAKQGLLLPEEYASIDWECTPDCINYGVMYEKRYAVLRCAAKRQLAKPGADYRRFVKENDVCTIMSYKGKVFGIESPRFADLVVTSTEPGFAGNTATNVTKPATVETGAEIKVPLFINEGDKISIDTTTGEYLGRSKA